jgi:hypothetical protein
VDGTNAPATGWKKTTMSKVGPFAGQPAPLGPALLDVVPGAPALPLLESSSVTRWTPLISRSRDISWATSSWVPVQPFNSNAGASIALRTAPPLPAEGPPEDALEETVATSD